MKNIKVASVCLNQTPLDWSHNFENIRNALLECRKKKVQVVCLPELCISGYGCEDAFFSPFVVQKSWDILEGLIPQTKDMIVSFGLPYYFKGSLFNVSALVVNGRLEALIPKKFLAGNGVHYEPRWFRPWQNGVCETDNIKLNSVDCQVPIGDYFIELSGIKLGLEICEEAWVAKRVGVGLSQKAVDIILNPSASHFAFTKNEIRKRFVIEGSRAFEVVYIFSNLLGNESGRVIFDGGGLVASNGQLVLESPRFSFKDYCVYDVVVDIEENRIKKTQNASYSPHLGQKDPSQLVSNFNWNFISVEPSVVKHSTWEESGFHKEEEFFRATSLALFDYLRKSNSKGFMISLSGGVDSSVVSILSTYSLKLAYSELGEVEFKRKLKIVSDRKNKIEDFVKQMVTCVYQSTEFSSDQTKKAAQSLSKSLGVEFIEWSVDETKNNYIDLVQEHLGKSLSWEVDDLSLQNIQARVRSPGIWLLANVKGALLLSTSNRSEAAVGYATMDGDTSGGVSPIAGVDKAFLINWLKWFQAIGPIQVGAIGDLSNVFVKPPTAELRPTEMNQTDETDLMPYEILNAIEKSFIRDRQNPIDIVEQVSLEFTKWNKKDLARFTIKFLQLWSRNQWKRERLAPAFHLDDESLDPKTWCRYPILMSSFTQEVLEIQKKYID